MPVSQSVNGFLVLHRVNGRSVPQFVNGWPTEIMTACFALSGCGGQPRHIARALARPVIRGRIFGARTATGSAFAARVAVPSHSALAAILRLTSPPVTGRDRNPGTAPACQIAREAVRELMTGRGCTRPLTGGEGAALTVMTGTHRATARAAARRGWRVGHG